MNISRCLRLRGGVAMKVQIPNFSRDKCQILSSVSITFQPDTNSEFEVARNVDVEISTGKSKIFSASMPYFQFNDNIDLADRQFLLSEGNDVWINLISRLPTVTTYMLKLTYSEYYGNIIYQEKFTSNFDSILEKVHESGWCTRLHLGFSQPVSKVAMTCNYGWLDDLELGDEAENIYVVDFYNKDSGVNLHDYISNLRFMELSFPKIENSDNFTVSVVAYGFRD